jgi:hypothetical protein
MDKGMIMTPTNYNASMLIVDGDDSLRRTKALILKQ